MHTSERKLGCESRLVQAKLGYDLRAQLEPTSSGGLPSRLQRLVDELMGYVPFRVVAIHAQTAPVVAGTVEPWDVIVPVADGSLAALVGDQANDTLPFPSV